MNLTAIQPAQASKIETTRASDVNDVQVEGSDAADFQAKLASVEKKAKTAEKVGAKTEKAKQATQEEAAAMLQAIQSLQVQPKDIQNKGAQADIPENALENFKNKKSSPINGENPKVEKTPAGMGKVQFEPKTNAALAQKLQMMNPMQQQNAMNAGGMDQKLAQLASDTSAIGAIQNGDRKSQELAANFDESQLPLRSELKVGQTDLNLSKEQQINPNQAMNRMMPNPQQNLQNDPLSPTAPRTGAVSTDDYLSLRNSLKRKGSESLGAQSPMMNASAQMQHTLSARHAAPLVEAQTTENGKGKMILSHDALDRITNQVQMFTHAKQDGEMKIRLRPDHLGELQMSVKAQGQNVSVQIRTTSGEAKRIIEESLGSLKNSLSMQHLNLAKVDVVTQPNASHAMSSDNFNPMDSSQNRNNPFEQNQNTRDDRFVDDMPEPRRVNISQIPVRPQSASLTQGLDLIA